MATTTSTATATSGLDVNNLVNSLMMVERQPLNKLNAQEASYQAKLSAYGSIKSAVSSLQTALANLTSSKFQALTTSLSDATVASASTTSSAVAGIHSLEVSALAQAQKLATAGQSSTSAAIGTGELIFEFGTTDPGPPPVFTSNGSGTHTVTIDSSNNTLAGIRDAINAANFGVTASIVNDGGANPYRLVLTSQTGLDRTLQITTNLAEQPLIDLLNHEPGGPGPANLTETVAASNATIVIDGVTVSQNANQFSDVVSGINLTVNKVTTTPVTLTVSKDASAINSAIGNFVKAYNDLMGTLKKLSAYDPVNKSGATLQGDGTVRLLQSQFRAILNTSVTAGSYTSLSDIGIGFKVDGTLAIDQARLDAALSGNYADVATLFTSTGIPKGYAVQLNTLASDVLSSNGLITTRTNGINASIKQIANRKLDLEARLTQIEKRYRIMYSNLDAMLGSMNVTSNYLTQQLARL